MGARKLLVSVTLVAISLIFCSSQCKALEDCFGNEYKETMSLEELKSALGSCDDVVGETMSDGTTTRDRVVARLLAESGHKEQALFDGVTVSELLEFTRDYSNLSFCNQRKFESWTAICEQLSAKNQYLADYCTRGLARLHNKCTESIYTLYNDYIRGWFNFRHLLLFLDEVVEHYDQKKKADELSVKESVQRYMASKYHGEVSSKGGEDPFAKLCAEYYNRLEDFVFYFDKETGMKTLHEYLLSNGHEDEVILYESCTQAIDQ